MEFALISFIQPNNRPTDRQCVAIGRIASAWAVVEYLMERTLTRLALSPSLLGYVLTDKLGPDNRIEAIKSLITAHRTKYNCVLVADEILAEISALLPTLKLMKSDRNFAVHSVWSSTGEHWLSHFDIAAAARSGKDMSAGTPEKTADLETFANSIQLISDKLWAVSFKLPQIDPTLLEKLRKLEQPAHRPESARSARQLRPRSWAQLPPDNPPPKPKRGRKRK